METKVLIGIPTAEYARRADFYDYYNQIDKPEGTLAVFAHGQSPARNRNLIIEAALENECTHVLFIDDDTAFRPDILKRLLSHNKDIVTGLYLMRHYPHQPIIFDFADEEGKCGYRYLEPGVEGLIEIVGTGLGCCLIKTDVFKAMEKPWIRLGELEADHWCDDIGFFKRVRKEGFKLYCDTTVRVGHIASMVVWPELVNGIWMTRYDTAGTGNAMVKQLYPDTVRTLSNA